MQFYPSKRGKIGNCTAVLLQCSDGESERWPLEAWCGAGWKKTTKPQVPTEKENVFRWKWSWTPWSLTWGLANNPKAPSIALGGGGPVWEVQGGWDPECTQQTEIHADSWPLGSMAALPPTMHGCSATLQPSESLSAWDQGLFEWASATRLGTLNQEWTLGGGPLLPGMSRPSWDRRPEQAVCCWTSWLPGRLFRLIWHIRPCCNSRGSCPTARGKVVQHIHSLPHCIWHPSGSSVQEGHYPTGPSFKNHQHMHKMQKRTGGSRGFVSPYGRVYRNRHAPPGFSSLHQLL